MTAVLDWEMATVGDPLADLGLSLTYWSLPEAQKVAAWSPRRAGGPGADDRPVRRAHRVRRLGPALVRGPGTFKLAVILQQIYARYAHGQTHERFARMGQLPKHWRQARG
jgi:aminoglycoside phosphotransferase (APT) family kinase protein